MKRLLSITLALIITVSFSCEIRGFALEKREKVQKEKYSVSQAVSDKAQLTTIAFSGLAFLTGNEGADSFFPPGKVADFFGFQYMRDIDENGYGHNTTFLTKVASNVLYILNEDQLQMLKDLAAEQADLYKAYGNGRLEMIHAFRLNYEGTQTLDKDAVIAFSEYLYEMDGSLSYHRAKTLGAIIRSLDANQINYLSKMEFNDSSTWPEMDEREVLDPSSMSHLEHVAVMTYASELFSWYKGSLDADVYFCPERHGTYFGGFYLKDYAAMGNPEYFISTSVTGDKGAEFLEILNSSQRQIITRIVNNQQESLNRIVEIRTQVSMELRKFMTQDSIDEDTVMELLKEYGKLEGEMSYLYATRFAQVGKTLSEEQREQLVELRNLNAFPEGAYLYSNPIALPVFDSPFEFSIFEDQE